MQVVTTLCDMKHGPYDDAEATTVDLSWIREGFEADLCGAHQAELTENRKRLEDVWLEFARRKVTAPKARNKTTVLEVVPVDGFRIGPKGRKVKVVPSPCTEKDCDRVFDNPMALAGHRRWHDPSFERKDSKTKASI